MCTVLAKVKNGPAAEVKSNYIKAPKLQMLFYPRYKNIFVDTILSIILVKPTGIRGWYFCTGK